MNQLKSDFKTLTLKDCVMYLMAVGCLVSATVIIFIGLYMPPEGELHQSLISFYGIALAFCGAVLGISAHYTSQISRRGSRPDKDGFPEDCNS